MTETVGQVTKEEFDQPTVGVVVEASVEQKPIELLDDPDEGLEVREAVRDRLLQQRQAVSTGEQGLLLEDLLQQRDLE